MLSVSQDPVIVESQLLSGQLCCPRCDGRLKPWGFGLKRIIRFGTPSVNRWVRPRRARCHECGATQILLPVTLAARRADDAAVISDAVDLNVAAGWGHRRIAEKLGRPVSTVRDWLRDFRANAPAILKHVATRVHQATAEALGFWPAPGPTVAADALAMLLAHARMLAQRYHRPGQDQRSDIVGPSMVSLTWHQAALLAEGPWLFSRFGWA